MNLFRDNRGYRGAKGGEAVEDTPLFSSSSESRLIERATAGDRRAFDSLTQIHASSLESFLARRVGPRDLDDVLQETWLAAWASLLHYDRRSKFRTWLFAIGLNKARDHFRSRSRISIENEAEPGEESPYTETGYQQTELGQVLREVLAEMPETQREVIELYYFEGLNLAEVASRLKRNLNTVKYQFYRAHAEAAARLSGGQGLSGDESWV